MPMRASAPWTIAAAGLIAALSARPVAEPADVPALLARIGERVEQYYARAQNIIFTETVRLQPLSSNLSFDDARGQTLVYEVRISWPPPEDRQTVPDPQVLRELITVNGHEPRAGDEPECAAPRPVTIEPLAMLLPSRQGEYAFTWRGRGRTDRRESIMLDYRATTPGELSMSFTKKCISMELPGRERGRVWTDPESGDVLRFDEELAGMFEFRLPKEHMVPNGPTSIILERANTSIKYHPVVFHDPDQTVLMPVSIERLTFFRNAHPPGMRTTQTFTNYRRFMTSGRIVKDPGAG
jgi:hypothetical protein